MKKYLRIIFLLVFLINLTVHAQNNDRVNELLNKVKENRNRINLELNLSETQSKAVFELNNNCYLELEPEFKKMAIILEELEQNANSDSPSLELVKKSKKDFRIIEKKLNFIKKDYEKEFKSILNVSQNKKYKSIKKQIREEAKKELQKQKEIIKNN